LIDLLRLFTEFQQLQGGTDKHYENTDLGLTLTRRLVEAQNGHVGVRSVRFRRREITREIAVNSGIDRRNAGVNRLERFERRDFFRAQLLLEIGDGKSVEIHRGMKMKMKRKKERRCAYSITFGTMKSWLA